MACRRTGAGAGAAAAVAVAALALAGCPASPYPEAQVDLTSPPATAAAPAAPRTLRFSVAAMLSPQDTFDSYAQLLDRLGTAVGERVELVQRRTYAEVNELIAAGKVDAALLCAGGYLELVRSHPAAVEVIAVPSLHGETTYRSYVIVPAPSRARRLSDLEGKRFAFTDELSLTGRVWVSHALRRAGRDPATFFGSTQLTGSHDRSIDAVARGVVDGASVDSLVFDRLVAARPALATAVRIIDRSPPFGVAPVVVSTRLPPGRRAELRNALLALSRDPGAAPAFRMAGFDGFVSPSPHLYDSAAETLEASR